MPYSPAIARELRRIVGNEHVIDNHNDLRIFERDGSIEGAMPEAIVLPSSSEQVADVMSVAAKHRIPIVPRGAGTGLSGGAVTINGGIALQMSRMRRIIEIDTVAQTAVVEPGVVNLELSVVAAQHGLFYAPDPASQKACTIGGNAAENSGGPHCLYYGVTTNHVVGMEVVLADGSVHWVSGDAPDRVGLDLCGVLVGSEGTLCAITKIKVRLLRTPPSVATLLAAFPTIDAASQAVSAVIGQGIVPAALEMMDSVTVGAVEAHYHAGYPTEAGAAGSYAGCSAARSGLGRDPVAGDLGSRSAEKASPQYVGCFPIAVTVIYRYDTLVPFLGSAAPNVLTIRSTTTMLAEY